MNLVPQKGFRSVFSYAEVGELLGLRRGQVKYLVQAGKLKRRYGGKYGFDQGDVNQFLTALNSGKAYRGRSA